MLFFCSFTLNPFSVLWSLDILIEKLLYKLKNAKFIQKIELASDLSWISWKNVGNIISFENLYFSESIFNTPKEFLDGQYFGKIYDLIIKKGCLSIKLISLFNKNYIWYKFNLKKNESFSFIELLKKFKGI